MVVMNTRNRIEGGAVPMRYPGNEQPAVLGLIDEYRMVVLPRRVTDRLAIAGGSMIGAGILTGCGADKPPVTGQGCTAIADCNPAVDNRPVGPQNTLGETAALALPCAGALLAGVAIWVGRRIF